MVSWLRLIVSYPETGKYNCLQQLLPIVLILSFSFRTLKFWQRSVQAVVSMFMFGARVFVNTNFVIISRYFSKVSNILFNTRHTIYKLKLQTCEVSVRHTGKGLVIFLYISTVYNNKGNNSIETLSTRSCNKRFSTINSKMHSLTHNRPKHCIVLLENT